VGCEKINSLLIVADLRGPEILNLLRVLNGPCHPPTTDPEFPVSERHRRQFHAHPIKPGYERLNVKFTHFRPHKQLRTPTCVNILGDSTAPAFESLLRPCNTRPQTLQSPIRAIGGGAMFLPRFSAVRFSEGDFVK
jgi:hypothetical protein